MERRGERAGRRRDGRNGGESSAPAHRRALRSVACAAVAFLVLPSGSLGFAAELDERLSSPSRDGTFVVSIAERPDPVPLNELHAWTVHVAAADGAPIDGASISVAGGMPMHDHGLPTAPRVTAELGGGDYLLEGMKFQMPGHWVVRLDIEADGTADVVTFELML